MCYQSTFWDKSYTTNLWSDLYLSEICLLYVGRLNYDVAHQTKQKLTVHLLDKLLRAASDLSHLKTILHDKSLKHSLKGMKTPFQKVPTF